MWARSLGFEERNISGQAWTVAQMIGTNVSPTLASECLRWAGRQKCAVQQIMLLS